MTKAFIFDFGGTIDTDGCHWGRFIWHAFERAKAPVSEADFRSAYVYAERFLGRNAVIKPDYSFHRTLCEKLRIEMEHLSDTGAWHVSEEQKAALHSVILDDLYNKVCLITRRNGLILKSISSRWPLALVSNFYGNMNAVLREFGLEAIFRHVIESAAVGFRKPDPHIFQLAINALALPPADITVVGDSMKNDIKPALALGCHAIWLKGEGWNNDPQDESMPDKVISSLTEIGLLYAGK